MDNRLRDEAGWAAEVRRHLGELHLALPHPDRHAAERAFRIAIDIARGQETPSWELRATTSLARLLHHQGRASEAHEILGEMYGWFGEGHDWPYLVEACELLATLDRAQRNGLPAGQGGGIARMGSRGSLGNLG